MKNGGMGTGEWSHARWCEGHGAYHGPLFPCPHYPDAVLAKIAEDDARYRRDIVDAMWTERQVQRGVPPVVIGILRALVGA